MKFRFTIERPRPGVMTWKLIYKRKTFEGTVERPRCKVERLILDCINQAAGSIERDNKCNMTGVHEAIEFRQWICDTNFAWVFSWDRPILRGTAPRIGESREAVERFKF